MARTTIDKSLIGTVNSSSLVGTTTNDSAVAGYVGQFVETINTYPNNFPTTSTYGDGTSISLTAGDWDVTATIYVSNKGTTTTIAVFGISQTSGNSTTGLTVGSNWFFLALPVGSASQDASGCISAYRQSLASTTTIYLKISATYTGTTPQYGCRLTARRVR